MKLYFDKMVTKVTYKNEPSLGRSFMNHMDTIDKLVVADALLYVYERQYILSDMSEANVNRRDTIFCAIQDLVGGALTELEKDQERKNRE